MNITDFKAGQPEDRYQYKAFLPERISHELVVAEDPELSELLGRADRALGELNAFAQLILDIEIFIRMYVAKEATQSSRIEGTQTNIEDAFKDATDLNPDERDDWSEVQNYIHAVNYAIDALEDLPLSNRLLRQTRNSADRRSRREQAAGGVSNQSELDRREPEERGVHSASS
jgi:Fic family protein